MPIARVELPDGRIGRFEVRAGTTPEQVLAFAQQNIQAQPIEQQVQAQPQVVQPTPVTQAPQAAPAGPQPFIRGPQDVLPEFGRGLLRGGEKVITGALQAGADIAGRAFPKSERIQQFRELLPETEARARQQFEAITGDGTAGRVGEFVGEVAPFAAALPAGGASLIGRGVAGALGGALAGATGVQEQPLTPEQALQQRGEQAEVGAALGLVIPGVAKGLGAAAGAVGRLARGRSADKILASRISPAQAEEALTELQKGQISILPDVAGDEIQGLTRAVGKTIGGGRNTIAEALETRSGGAVRRVSNALSKDISNVDTYFANLDDIAKARSELAAPLYKKAYAEATDINRDKLNKLLQDQRIDDALNEAKASFGVRLEANSNSLEALDGAKKALDDIIGSSQRAGQNQKAASFLKLKGQLVEELDAASPSYKQARRVFSDFSSLQRAQEEGLDFTRQTPEQIKRLLKTFDNTQKEAFKIGVRENLQRTVSKTADQADPAKRVFGNEFKRDQLKTIFGEGDQFNKFSKAMEEEIRAAKTKFRVLGGSRTDINIADDGQFIEATADAARRGLLSTTFDITIGSIARAAKRRYTGLTSKNARELANILSNREAGIEAMEALITRTKDKTQQRLLQDASKDFGQLLGIAAATGIRE